MMKLRLPLLPKWVRWGAVLTIAVFIFYVSIVMVPPETPIAAAKPNPVPLDKWRHFLVYAALGGALAYATCEWDIKTRYAALFVLTVAVLYGVGIEFGQSFLPRRYFSVGDAYANALGGVLVLPWFLIQIHAEFLDLRTWLSL